MAYTLGYDSDRSDYDFQVCSDTIMRLVSSAYPDGTDGGRSIYSIHGGGLRVSVVLPLFPALVEWAQRWDETLGRGVNITVFSSAGPSEEGSSLSEHDWVIIHNH